MLLERLLFAAALAAPAGVAQSVVLDDLEQRARAALERIPHAGTKAEADAARPAQRRRLEESLGFRRLPWPPDLRASVTGTLRFPGYRIEKVVFQSLPDTWVPAHLYLPEGVTSPAPGILFYNGHWWPDSKSRPDFQAFCINMARLGFVVFSFDPFGQGERGVSSRDHRRTEALLVGISQQGIAEYETRCALEYLLARPEVDRSRIGMTGASGGGYNTWITAALDDRIAAAVPVVGTSDFYEQIHVTRPLDWYHAAEHCHYVPGLIRYANNHEFVAMAAPKPVLIVSASVDQSFPIAGVRAVAEYGRKLYRSYGAAEKIGLFVDEAEGHGYQKAKREAAYGWFLRWLLRRGDGRPLPEPPTQTLAFDAPELRSFADGQKRAAGPGIMAAVRRLAREMPPAGALSLQPLDPAPLLYRVSVHNADGRSGTMVAIDDRGRAALAADPIVSEAVRRGWAVRAVDPRGIGELETPKSGWVFAVSLLLGENFVRRQGTDIRGVLDGAAAAGRVALYARGDNAVLAATYALAAPGPIPAWAVLRDGFSGTRQFLERPRSLAASFRLLADDVREQRKTAFDREIPHEYFLFGALQSRPPAWKAKTYVIDPIDGDWARTAGNTTLEEFLRTKW